MADRLGAIGLTGIVGSSVLTLTRQEDGVLLPIATLLGGFLLIYALFAIRPVDRLVQRVIERMLRRYTDLDTQDYRSLLRLSGDYAIRQFDIRPGGRLEGHSIAELLPQARHLVLLGVEHPDGSYVASRPRTRCCGPATGSRSTGTTRRSSHSANVRRRPIDQES